MTAEHENRTSKIMQGITVLDLTHVMAGPACTMSLADMGAEVIKIEQPGKGDLSRDIYDAYQGGEGALFLNLNRSKKSVTLNLKHEKGREVLYRLAERSDVFIENFRGGVAEKLRLDYETISSRNPSIIYCSLSAFGNDGPYKAKPGVDAILQAVGGVMSCTGEKDGPPCLCGAPVVDMIGALLASQGILAALLCRERTGVGQKVETSLLNGILYAQIPRFSTYFVAGRDYQPMGSGHAEIVPYQAFCTREGTYLFMGVLDEQAWRRLCDAMGLEHLKEDARFASNEQRVKNRDELVHKLEQVFLKLTAHEALARLEEGDILCGPVNTLSDLMDDPQVHKNEMIIDMEHPTAGKVDNVGIPVQFSKTPASVQGPSPVLGQHTHQVLTWLDYSSEEIEEFRSEKVI
jgi:crotonobetainyl-CoA:carnitine CoA-transferase CaiB-like acyl-CoA transferase